MVTGSHAGVVRCVRVPSADRIHWSSPKPPPTTSLLCWSAEYSVLDSWGDSLVTLRMTS